MTALKDLAKKIIASFDPKSSIKIAEVLAEILQTEGFNKYESHVEAERLKFSVLAIFRNQFRPEELPFDFGSSDPTRLVGKVRRRKSDTPETFSVRQLWRFSGNVLNAILEKDITWFEILCAACLIESGAKEAYALCSGDEGGIDLFGRIPIGRKLIGVTPGILETNLFRANILFLGQCKRYTPRSKVGPRDIRDFMDGVTDCLKKYEGNPRPPSHRVPCSYYRKGELCIPIFLTTADYSDKSAGKAESSSLIIINGRQISEFICSKKIGFILEDDRCRFDKNLLYSWIQQKSGEVDYRKAKP